MLRTSIETNNNKAFTKKFGNEEVVNLINKKCCVRIFPESEVNTTINNVPLSSKALFLYIRVSGGTYYKL